MIHLWLFFALATLVRCEDFEKEPVDGIELSRKVFVDLPVADEYVDVASAFAFTSGAQNVRFSIQIPVIFPHVKTAGLPLLDVEVFTGDVRIGSSIHATSRYTAKLALRIRTNAESVTLFPIRIRWFDLQNGRKAIGESRHFGIALWRASKRNLIPFLSENLPLQVALWSARFASGRHSHERTVAERIILGIRQLSEEGKLTYRETLAPGGDIDAKRNDQVTTLIKTGAGLCGELSRLAIEMMRLHGIESHMHQIVFATVPPLPGTFRRARWFLRLQGKRKNGALSIPIGYNTSVTASFRDHAFVVLDDSNIVVDPTYTLVHDSLVSFLKREVSTWEFCECTGPNEWDGDGEDTCDDRDKLRCVAVPLQSFPDSSVIDTFTGPYMAGNPPVILRKFLPNNEFFVYNKDYVSK